MLRSMILIVFIAIIYFSIVAVTLLERGWCCDRPCGEDCYAVLANPAWPWDSFLFRLLCSANQSTNRTNRSLRGRSREYEGFELAPLIFHSAQCRRITRVALNQYNIIKASHTTHTTYAALATIKPSIQKNTQFPLKKKDTRLFGNFSQNSKPPSFWNPSFLPIFFQD